MPPAVRYLLAVALLVAAGLAVRAWVAVPRAVSSASMLPTLWPGDVLLVRRSAAPFARGDVIVFRGADGGDVVKRVIGLPGDWIAFQDGRLVVSGERVARFRVADLILPLSPNLPCPVPLDGQDCRLVRHREMMRDGRGWDVLVGSGAWPDLPARRVPEGRLFVLGDNRARSADSRAEPPAGTGLVPIAAVVGRAELILFSTDGSWTRGDPTRLPLRLDRALTRVERAAWPG